MAEIVKAKEKQKIVKVEEKPIKKKKIKQETKKEGNVNSDSKKTLWDKFMIFCHGVKGEFKKVRWTSKQDMFKYSIATIVFILFCSIFFYGIDTVFAFVQSLFK